MYAIEYWLADFMYEACVQPPLVNNFKDHPVYIDSFGHTVPILMIFYFVPILGQVMQSTNSYMIETNH